VAADIIRRILERAEENLGARIINCTVSHPSRFSLRQIDDLREAFVACGIPRQNIRTVHESIGAALDYIQQKEVREKHDAYSLMVFDFGGGTTDITLLKVRNERFKKPEVTVITPDVLGATGDPTLGGENVTLILMGLVLERYEQVLRSRYPDATIVIPFRREEFNDPYRQRLAVENRNFLRQWSEAAKIAISHFGDDYDRRLVTEAVVDGINIRSLLSEFKIVGKAAAEAGVAVIINNQVQAPGSEQTKVAPAEVIPTSEEINSRLRPRLEQISLMMKGLAENNNIKGPDIILLSGKSSALPIVREVVTEYFPDSEIALPNDLKECVARGACQLDITDPIAGVFLRIDDSKALSATTSRLGLRVSHTGQLMFQNVVDAGVPIEADGLSRPVPGIVLKRNTRIRIMENTSLDDRVMVNGGPNPNITVLRVFSLDAKLKEWEEKNNQRITDSDLFDADIQLVVTPNLVVKLVAEVPRMGEALEFEAELGGW
jgi:Hsp70 protein/Virulence factor SrfB